MSTRNREKEPELRFAPGRDPLSGLENHPLFRDLPPIDEKTGEQTAKRALQLAYAQLRREQEKVAELQQQLEATAAEKRRLMRDLASLEKRSKRTPQTGAACDGTDFEALFTGELPTAKTTLNSIPVELKAFLTTTKVNLRAESGAQFTERDQVICALAAYRLLMQSLPERGSIINSIKPADTARFSARFGGFLLAWLAAQLNDDE